MRRFVALADVTGSFVDAVSGELRTVDCSGPLAMTVADGRLIGIAAPGGPQVAMWFSVPVAEVRAEVRATGGLLRKKPTVVRLSFDSIEIEASEVDLLLKTMSQAGQAGALLEALTAGPLVSGTEHELPAPPPGQSVTMHAAPAAPGPAAPPLRAVLAPDPPDHVEQVEVGDVRLIVEQRTDDLPARSALWADVNDAAAALNSLFRSFDEAGCPERWIIHGFIDAVVRPGPLDSVAPIVAPWSDPLDGTTLPPAGSTVMPPTSISLMAPDSTYRSLASGRGALAPWMRRLVALADAPPERSFTATLFRYCPPDPDKPGKWGLMSLGRNEAESSLALNDSALSGRWVGEIVDAGASPKQVGMLTTFVWPDLASLIEQTRQTRIKRTAMNVEGRAIVPTETISEIELKANFDASSSKKISDASKRLAAARGYGNLRDVDCSLIAHDGWRPVKITFSVGPDGGDDQVLSGLLSWVNSIAATRGIDARLDWPQPVLVEGVGKWMRGVLRVDLPGAVPFGIDRSLLAPH